jgi:serine/threonine protein kinase
VILMEHMGVGSILNNKYKVLTLLGTGGMSRVWLARDMNLSKLWAIKAMKTDVAPEIRGANRQAILKEAHLMNQLDHPYIPRVVEICDTPGHELYVVMDFCEGVPLSVALKQHPDGFSQEQVIAWGIQLCEVLGYLHHRSPAIVYRDMKPHNIMLKEDGTLRLIDFGIAEEMDGSALRDERLIGTFGYSAPEQLGLNEAKTTVDARADIYALGATLFSLVTGRIPSKEADVSSDSSNMRALDIVPIRTIKPKLSDGLEYIILRATRNDVHERYQDIADMQYDLMHCEKLTKQYQDNLRHVIRRFNLHMVAGATLLAISLACYVGASAARRSSYEQLLQAASLTSLASKPKLLIRALTSSPGCPEAYEKLLEVYKADGVLSVDEEQQWQELWKANSAALKRDDRYAEICYNAGILYLCYFDYRAQGENLVLKESTSGRKALEAASSSYEWFKQARETMDARMPQHEDTDTTARFYTNAHAYEIITSFHVSMTEAGREGKDLIPLYQSMWQQLQLAWNKESQPQSQEPTVQLKLAQVSFEMLSSPLHLKNLARAGVTRKEIEGISLHILATTRAQKDFAAVNDEVAAPIYQEIVEGTDLLARNIEVVFANPVTRLDKEGEA